uniref:Uncharacterized protein n=1 Tax=Oryza punctata TaxID=4537 RepID=A0A0E0JJE5_ORYPU
MRVIAEALKKAKAEIKALKFENEKLKNQNDSLALRDKADEAKALAARTRDEADSVAASLTQVTDSAREASYVHRLAL